METHIDRAPLNLWTARSLSRFWCSINVWRLHLERKGAILRTRWCTRLITNGEGIVRHMKHELSSTLTLTIVLLLLIPTATAMSGPVRSYVARSANPRRGGYHGSDHHFDSASTLRLKLFTCNSRVMGGRKAEELGSYAHNLK